MKYSCQKGTKDILPEEIYKWQKAESAFAEVCEKYGYNEIRIPTFEQTDLFQRSVGDTTDVVQKEMYTFEDKGGRSITLRPEGTAGVVRSFVENGMSSLPSPVRLFYNITAFRYEKMQKGRYREFHQFGCEAFGAEGPTIDAEIISILVAFFERMGLKKTKLCINSIGCPTCRAEYNKILKDYFEGRSKLSQAYQLSRQVMTAPDTTLGSYMSITFDKMNLFNDRGLCGLTSATDIHVDEFTTGPCALFLKIPDEKDTRHALASLFILSTYKALIKIATSLPGQTLPRNVYFIMDEFGNMPKIDKFGQMITVGRSRKIWFSMVVQSFVQLTNVYGKEVADIVIGNCGVKMFIGSNDTDTCKMFSEMCGNMTVRTTSTSSSLGSKAGDINVSTNTQVRLLIYPSELQRLNNQESTGNSIIVSFNSFPLKTKYTPSYKCPYYTFGPMDLTEIRSNMFRADEVFYDLRERNEKVLGAS